MDSRFASQPLYPLSFPRVVFPLLSLCLSGTVSRQPISLSLSRKVCPQPHFPLPLSKSFLPTPFPSPSPSTTHHLTLDSAGPSPTHHSTLDSVGPHPPLEASLDRAGIKLLLDASPEKRSTRTSHLINWDDASPSPSPSLHDPTVSDPSYNTVVCGVFDYVLPGYLGVWQGHGIGERLQLRHVVLEVVNRHRAMDFRRLEVVSGQKAMDFWWSEVLLVEQIRRLAARRRPLVELVLLWS